MVSTACSFRPAYTNELARARHVFPAAPTASAAPLHWFLALRETPVERIVGALWCRHLPRAGCVEFDWISNGSMVESELRAFFSAWREELQKLPSPPASLRLHGWHPVNAAPERKLKLFGATCTKEEKTRWTTSLDALLERLPPVPAALEKTLRPLAPADLPAVRGFVEGGVLFEHHELLEGLQSAAGGSPSLFDLRTSVAAFEASAITGLCLTNYTASIARVCALAAAAPDVGAKSLDRALLRLALERLREHSRVERVVFDCPLADALSAGLGLEPAGVLHRCSIPFGGAQNPIAP
jgi:hypothetical protein